VAYDKEIYKIALEILRDLRKKAEKIHENHKEKFYRREPRAREIDQELSRTGILTAKAVISGANITEQLNLLRKKNSELQKEREFLRLRTSLPDDFLEIPYKCTKCQDTGYIKNEECTCLKRILKKEAYKKFIEKFPAFSGTLNDFKLEYYSENNKDQMKKILEFCKRYSKVFKIDKTRSVFLQGGTGSGKTHLILAMAAEIAKKGHKIIYTSVESMVKKLSDEKFSYQKDNTRNMEEYYMDCDLLILDDLGMEFQTSYSKSAVYNIIDLRLLSKKPHIIITNFTKSEISKIYSSRLISRLFGEYIFLKFSDEDLRQKINNSKIISFEDY